MVCEYRKHKSEAVVDGTDASPLDVDEIVKVILALVAENAATILIDALDERQPQTRWHLLKALDRLVYESENLVNVFTSSRDDV